MLEDEIGVDLEHTTKEPDIKVSPWDIKNGNIADNVGWYHHWEMPDGKTWLTAGHKENKFYVLHFIDEEVDFALSKDGKLIYYQCLSNFDPEIIRHILITQVLPLIMNLRGLESLHASSVFSPSGAIIFIGRSGYGKSTLAASLIKGGYHLLSDNVVPVFESNSQIWTCSGPPDIGLWPQICKTVNPELQIKDPTEKCRLVLSKKEYINGEFPISHIYLLEPLPDSTLKTPLVKIELFPSQGSCIELLKAAFRLDFQDPNMLQHQFVLFTNISKTILIKKVIYSLSTPDLITLGTVIKADIESKNFQSVPLASTHG